VGAVAGLLRIDAVDGVDAEHRRVLLVAAGGASRTGDHVALAHGELPHLLDRDVDVVLAREVALEAQEAVALVAQVEQALDLDGLAHEGLVLLGPVGAPVTAAASAATVAGLAVALDLALAALDRLVGVGLVGVGLVRVGGAVEPPCWPRSVVDTEPARSAPSSLRPRLRSPPDRLASAS